MFIKKVEKYRLFNPMNGSEEEVEVEIRFDPLTGKPSRIVKKPLPFTKGSFEEDIKKPCPFCEDVVEKVAARDVEILGGELKRKGDSILFANISPYARYSLVVRVCREHYLNLDEFRKEDFFNSLSLALEYLEKVEGIDYATITMNYLKPAGSSVVHPHIQLIASKELMDYQSRIVSGAKSFYENHGRQFWEAIAEREELIVKRGRWIWFVPFAPRGFDHVSAYLSKPLLEINEEELEELSEGIVRVLKYYSSEYNSFNFGVFGSLKRTPYFGTLFDMVARTPFDKYYWCDVFAITKIYDEAYTNKEPEETAKRLRELFR